MVSDSSLHALIGAVVTVALSFVPFSPVLGGGVAAYLSEADANEGVRLGAISGVIASVPLFLFGLFLVAVLGFFTVSGPSSGAVAFGIGGLLIVGVFGLLVVLYTVGLSALGGYLGSYLVDEL